MNTLQAFSQELVELSGRLIGEKVLITDTAGIIIGCTDTERLGELHEASLDVMQTGLSNSHDNNAASSLRGTFAGITLPLEYENRVVGSVGITGDPERVVQYGQMIRAFIEMILRFRAGQRQLVVRDRESLNLIREILYFNGAEDQETRISGQANAIGYDLAAPYAALVVQTEEKPEDPDILQNTVVQVFDPVTNIVGAFSPGQVIVLADHAAGGHDTADISRLLDQCRKLHENLEKVLNTPCVIGIGGAASGIPDLQEACRDALFTAHTAMRMNPRPAVLSAEEVALERIISKIPDKTYSHAASRAMEIIRDQKDAEEIKQMIVTWCQQGFSVSDTARALFIHKNTLLYRMERLQRLTGYDLRVFRDALTLYLMIGMQQFRNVSAENVRAFLQPNYSEGPEKHGAAR